MKCSFCDHELQPGAQVCEACGAPVEEPRTDPFDLGGLPSTPVESAPPLPAFTLPETPPIPPAYPPSPFSAAPSERTIFGLPASQTGVISLVLGILGIALSCIGCGGLLSLLGLAAGYLSLKTSSRQNGIIGMVLSSIGLVLTLALLCLLLFNIPSFQRSGG